VALAAYALYIDRRRKGDVTPRSLRIYPYAIALPYAASTAGWLLTETGRFPWVVYGVMRIEDAVSPSVTGGMVVTTLAVFTVLYGALMAAAIYLMAKYARKGAATLESLPESSSPVSLLAGS